MQPSRKLICLFLLPVFCCSLKNSSVCTNEVVQVEKLFRKHAFNHIQPKIRKADGDNSAPCKTSRIIKSGINVETLCIHKNTQNELCESSRGDMTVANLYDFKDKSMPQANISSEMRNFGSRTPSQSGKNLQDGRLFSFKGVKKMIWALFVGLQIIKTALLALLLPSILGSFGKIFGKGISAASGFHKPSEVISGLDFKEVDGNGYKDSKGSYYLIKHDDDSVKFDNHLYESPTELYEPLSRLDISDQKLAHMDAVLKTYSSKNDVNDIASKNNFKTFLEIPPSSLLLTNYDPFYSPLLSRLDAVFQQLGLEKENDECRKKIVCSMYSNPAKYAPYSNLVSAQLSRELYELRKPNANNPEILRFFGYMRAAKDGQDGLNCEFIHKKCSKLTESPDPIMLTTYHEINKLVQARKF